MTKKINIGFISTNPPTDKRVWSGSIFKIYESFIRQGFEVTWIPIKYTPKDLKLFDKIAALYYKIFRRGFNKNQFMIKSLIGAKRIAQEMKGKNIDVLFAPTSATEIAFLNTQLPIVYFNDATFHQLLNYYGAMSGFGYLSKKATIFIENKALQKATHLVFSSEWAAHHARDFYGIPEKKISVVKFGSNSEVPERINLNKDYSQTIVFLFLAVDWERKGGAIALKAIEILREKGYPVMLQVVGCTPPVTSTAMEVIPFLNKNIPEEAQKVKDFLNNAHFMFIPTRADCTPISFCEAASYGMPIISTNTGGVSAHIEHGKTGILLSEKATAEDYATEIEQLLNNPDNIRQMSINAREKYERELNWEKFGVDMKEIIFHVLNV